MPRKAPLRRLAAWALVLAATLASGWVTGLNPATFEFEYAAQFLRGMFPPAWQELPGVLQAMGETLAIAFLGTLLPLLLAFPLSFVAARNLGPRWVGAAVRLVFSLLRSVPEILWGLLFVVAIGLGSPAGVVALTAHNLGILGKLFAEALESAPRSAREAVAVTGAGPATVFLFGVLPPALPVLASHGFFRLECNIRAATLLGVVGAGGIGNKLMVHRALFAYDKLLVDTLGILALVLLADVVGALLRRQVT